MITPDLDRYRQEKETWKEAGKPTRSDERVEELYNICASCEHHIKIIGDVLQCGLCSCIIRPDGERMNKLKWSTSSCPDMPPRWTSDIETKAEPPTQVFNQRKKQSGGGGCGCSS